MFSCVENQQPLLENEQPTQDSTSQNAESQGRKLPQYAASLTAMLGAMATGTVLGWTSPIEDRLKHGDYGFEISDSQMGWIASLVPIGAVVMCVPTGKITDALGRKLSLLLLAIPFLLGWSLILAANNIALIYAGRLILGMTSGAVCVVAPLYVGEIAEKEIRGTVGSFFQLLVTIGVLFVYIVGKYVSPFILTVVCLAVPIVFALLFVFMPESPFFLVMKGRISKAQASLEWLRGPEYNVQSEIHEIQIAVEEKRANSTSVRQMLSKTATKRACLISFGLMVFQQVSGVNAVVFYVSTIFKDADSSLDPQTAAILVGAMQVGATLISSYFVDRLGRKILLVISDTIMAICTLFIGIYFNIQRHNKYDPILNSLGYLPVAALCLFMIVYSLGLGPIPWLMLSEVFPQEVKTVASSAAAMLNWTLAFFITRFFEDVCKAIGTDTTFFLFTAASLVGSLFCVFVVIETKGKSLAEIQVLLGNGPVSNGIINEGFVH